MRSNILRWATAIGAIPRILAHYERLKRCSYYERLRFCNTVLGPDWIFRLHDIAGPDTIARSRSSWLAFYRDDVYSLHMPLDPRAPETDKHLGIDAGAKEFAFYSGMGFDGYLLALNTTRVVETNDSVRFDGHLLLGLDDGVSRDLASRTLTAQDYYSYYGTALEALFESYRTISAKPNAISEDRIEDVAAASLLFLCGGHKGCSAHIDADEEQQARLTTITICRFVEGLASGKLSLQSAQALEHAA